MPNSPGPGAGALSRPSPHPWPPAHTRTRTHTPAATPDHSQRLTAAAARRPPPQRAAARACARAPLRASAQMPGPRGSRRPHTHMPKHPLPPTEHPGEGPLLHEPAAGGTCRPPFPPPHTHHTPHALPNRLHAHMIALHVPRAQRAQRSPPLPWPPARVFRVVPSLSPWCAHLGACWLVASLSSSALRLIRAAPLLK